MDTMKIGHTNSRGSKDYFLKVLAAFNALFLASTLYLEEKLW